jgi:EmrB/QacA subfamily drug resistance transporter
MVIALVAQILVVVDISVVNTAMPSIARDLHLVNGDLQWIVAAYLLFSGGGLLLGGRIADLLPRTKVFLLGMALFTAASAVNALAGSAEVLIAGRAAQGAAAALMTPAALAIIMTTYSGVQRARGLTLWGAVGGLGIAAGVTAGGMLTAWASWEAIFWVNVPVGIATLFAAAHLFPRTRRPAGAVQLDVSGAVTGVGSLAALMFALSGAEAHGWLSVRMITGVVVAAALALAFVTIERHAKRPLVHPHTWRISSLVSSTTVMLGITGLLMALVFLTSNFAQTALGYSALEAGLAFLPLAATLVVGTHLASHVSTHLPARAIAALGLAIVGGGMLVLSNADHDATYVAHLLPGLAIAGLGAGLVFAAVAGTAMTGIPAEHAGMASGFLMTGHEIGAALGVAALGSVAATAGGLTDPVGAVDAFGRGSLVACLVAVALAALAAAWMPAGKANASAMHLH